MTDQEIIQGLIARNNRVTEEFFFVRCRPLFRSIIQKIFDYEVDYDEFVNELYIYLMEDDAAKLRGFGFRCTIYQWLKVLAIRFFIRKRGKLIEGTSHEHPYDKQTQAVTEETEPSANDDLQRLFAQMPNKRYVYVMKCLIIDDWEPERLAKEMNITTANLYNIKRRAMAQLTQVALKDIKEYGK